MSENELKQEYERYRMLMYSGGYDPVSFEEWRGIMYQPGLSEVERLRAIVAALTAPDVEKQMLALCKQWGVEPIYARGMFVSPWDRVDIGATGQALARQGRRV